MGKRPSLPEAALLRNLCARYILCAYSICCQQLAGCQRGFLSAAMYVVCPVLLGGHRADQIA